MSNVKGQVHFAVDEDVKTVRVQVKDESGSRKTESCYFLNNFMVNLLKP